MGRTIALFGILLASPIAGARAGDAEADAARLEFFESKVRPVLAERCFGCHGPVKQKAGLRLDSRAATLRGGDSGPALKPGDPEASRLIEAVRYDGETQMPPKGKLSEAEIATLTEWVKLGAPWPEATREARPSAPSSGFKISAEDRAFWAFQPIRSPAPPPVADASWPKSPIDHFILARLEAAKLRPVRMADKRTLIRRVSFDLTGLPPTPEEVDAFLADESPDAFARVVDRLLASPRYGERWGRHWLDVARYGEDQAHTFEARKYPYGYRYRDWVVAALNDDMPYDRFILEQIAGDLLDGPGRDDRLAALGLFALGPVYYGRAVYDELDDRVDTLCRGFLGLTVACARCHDHKFDPIGQKDYYGLAGIFASTQYKEFPRAPAEVVARYDQAQAAIKAKTAEIAAFVREESARWSEAATADVARYMVAAWTLVNRRKGRPDLPSEDIAKPEKLPPFVLDRWVKYLFPDGEDTRPHLARWRRVLAGQDRKADLSGDEAAKAEVAKVAQAFQEYVQSLQKLRDALKRQKEAAAALGLDPGGSAAEGPALGHLDKQVLRELVSNEGLLALPARGVETWLSAEAKAALKAKRAELARLQKEAPPKYPVVHTLTEGASPSDMKVFLRGNPATPGEEAPRRAPAILSAEGTPPFRQGSGRLELARAIAGKDNPLTARVIVNRVWAHHFGRGLVATPSNFGHMGERPTHPELLDFLASRLIATGWSLKALHREILLSATYQLAADFDPTNDGIDPGNTLLWRANRRRLEVEAWRDAMLAVSGELDPSLGGPPSDLAAPDNRRRTLYAAISRHNLDGLLRLFDFPDPNITSDKRPVTTVPLQQLFVLNSGFMERQAKALAARLAVAPDATDADRIRRAFPLLFARPATEREVRIGLEFLSTADSPGEDRGGPSKWEQYAQVLLGTNEFMYLD
jgi:mono/diheme cytochrome c family protein